MVPMTGSGNRILWHLAEAAVWRSIAEVCPRLRTLVYFPGSPGRVDSQEQSLLSNILRIQPVYHYLSTFRHLCDLETYLRPDSLKILAQLPRLNRLVLHGQHLTVLDLALGNNAFPALEHLSLLTVSIEEVEILLGLSPLVRNLISFKIEMGLSHDDQDWVVSHLFPRLGRMARLLDLHASLDCNGEMGDDIISINHPTVHAILAKLPLQTVRLAGLMFDDEIDLSTTFPVVTKLAMPDHGADPWELSSFGSIPHLEYLLLDIHLDGKLNYITYSSTRCLSLHTLETRSSGTLDLAPQNTIHVAE
jgi:hypothetical protein